MAFPFRKLLVPIDFHEHSLGAIEVAKNIAQVNGGMVTLLHVVPMDEPLNGPMYEEDFKKQAEKDAARLAELASQRLQGLRYEIVTEIGDPATGIIDTAASREVDVIVIGTHGRKGLRRILMGSVAEEVLREAKCPVIALRLERKS
ncbi:MAG: universal stress protein [Deltaproteobacteria bacterium]|nr:universal stress protein [Deltaproteobacteria bacterium]